MHSVAAANLQICTPHNKHYGDIYTLLCGKFSAAKHSVKRGKSMLKVAVIGVMGALLALLLKGEKAGQSLWIVLASCLLIMGISVAKLSDILTMIRDVEEALGSGALYLQVLLKMIGISYVAEFGAEICKDAGFGAVAGQIEFFGKIMLLAVSIPIIQNLVTLIGQMGL